MSVKTILPPYVAEPYEIPRDFPLWRLSVEKYHEMARTGILTENDPVELIEGWLVYKVPKKRPHSLVQSAVSEELRQILQPGWHIQQQDPITIVALDSEPEPDVAVVRGTFRDYPDRHPSASDAALLIEIADSSLQSDRGTKKRIYARAGIAVYWIVNLVDQQIEVYTKPTDSTELPDYLEKKTYDLEDEIPVIVDGQMIGSILGQNILP